MERGWMTVKCRVDDVYEGTTLVQKAMRFRVEISSIPGQHQALNFGTPSTQSTTPRMTLNPMSPPLNGVNAMTTKSRMNFTQAGYETIIAFVLEKGAVSTFKTIYQHLRGEWKLDSLQSPRSVTPGGMIPTSLDERMMV